LTRSGPTFASAEPDLTWFPPGEDVEEAAERFAVRDRKRSKISTAQVGAPVSAWDHHPAPV
jgi:hypothetical protein